MVTAAMASAVLQPVKAAPIAAKIARMTQRTQRMTDSAAKRLAKTSVTRLGRIAPRPWLAITFADVTKLAETHLMIVVLAVIVAPRRWAFQAVPIKPSKPVYVRPTRNVVRLLGMTPVFAKFELPAVASAWPVVMEFATCRQTQCFQRLRLVGVIRAKIRSIAAKIALRWARF